MKKRQIKAITFGAIIIAGYQLIALLSNYSILGPDSMVYYIYPLLLAIYATMFPASFSIAVMAGSIALSFAFASPIHVLALFLPNIFIGFALGFLEKKSENRLINYICVLTICMIADFLSVFAYEWITGLDYFTDGIDILLQFFPQVEEEIIKKMMTLIGFSVVILDAIVKTVLNYLIYSMIVKRFKLIPNFKPHQMLVIKYHPIVTGLFLVSFVFLMFSCYQYFVLNHAFYQVLFVIGLILNTLVGIYIIYQVVFYARLMNINGSNWIYIILAVVSFVFFPVTILVGCILNFTFSKNAKTR